MIWCLLIHCIFQCDVSRKVRSTRRIDIPVSEHIYGGMTKAELSEAQQRELQLAQMDKNMEQAKNEKNALESYVYEMRNKVNILPFPMPMVRFDLSDTKKKTLSKAYFTSISLV